MMANLSSTSKTKSSDVYFIIAGEVRVLIRTVAGKEVILGESRAGQFFGEMTAIDGTKRSANVTALTKSELCIMPAQCLPRADLFARRLPANGFYGCSPGAFASSTRGSPNIRFSI